MRAYDWLRAAVKKAEPTLENLDWRMKVQERAEVIGMVESLKLIIFHDAVEMIPEWEPEK